MTNMALNQQVVDEAMAVIKQTIKKQTFSMDKEEKEELYTAIEDHMLELQNELSLEEEDHDEHEHGGEG